ncbi:uncharacterized protein [Amphiura filiformis]|uniref:uncharacterized protein n=1 Tax=Amphiura filiformis TaxID=82378 RepID=UPI003B20F0A1
MRITSQLLRSRTKCSLNSIEYVDLSNLSIAFLEKLQQCPKLQTLILRGNAIEIVHNLESCHQLWRLDLGNNKICNLDGLSKFMAFGELNLSNNDLNWAELRKIRHMHILHLSLHGNKRMEKDPYYRIHVIDSLPNVWVLDGRIITSAERIQVQQFFQDSALTERPVRHKLTREQFVPTSMKKIQVDGIYGERTSHFMRRFPTHGSLNVDTDRRRVQYLAENLQRELQLESKHRKSDKELNYSDDLLQGLLKVRPEDRDRCNVLLILLVASLEFALPTFLVQETLAAATISTIGNCDTIELFLMPRDHRCQVTSLLLSAVKVDRDSKEDGGLYDKLYLCLYYTVTELIKKWHLEHPGPNTPKSRKVNAIYKEYKSLLAAEVVQLFCIVPVFFDYITKDSGTMRLVSMATSDSEMVDKVAALVERIRIEGGTTHRTIEEVAELLINTIHRNTKHVLKRKIPLNSSSTYVLSTPNAIPRRPMSSPVRASFFLTTGQHAPERAASALPSTAHSPRRHVVAKEIRTPALGDKVLLGPQNLAFIIALPEPDVGLVQMESIPVPNGSVVSFTKDIEQHFAYVDLTLVTWDRQHGYWKPKGMTGDKITIQNTDGPLPTNPPSSPTTGNSPTLSRRGSAKTIIDDENEEDDAKSQKSIKSIEDDIPRSVSSRLHERFKTNPAELERVATPSAKTSPRSSPLPEELDDSIDQSDEEKLESTTADEDGMLYDCLKIAVDTVQKNSPRRDEEEGGEHETNEIGEQEFEDEEVAGNSSSRPMSGMTERAADDILVDEFADVNLDSESLEQFINANSRPSSVARRNRPGTARTSASSRINSAKSSASWRSLPIARSQVIEVDLRPGNITSYQKERSDEWRNEGGVKGRPSSRQGSAYSRSSTPTRSREQMGSPVLIQYGNFWLAGGKDIHHRELAINKMKTQYSPGWKDGVTQRPRSSGVFRAKETPKQRRAVKSAGSTRERITFDLARPASKPPPSPASSDHAFHPLNPEYIHQAKQHNFSNQHDL